MVIDIPSTVSIQLTVKIPGPLPTCGGRELIFAGAAMVSYSKPNVIWKYETRSA